MNKIYQVLLNTVPCTALYGPTNSHTMNSQVVLQAMLVNFHRILGNRHLHRDRVHSSTLRYILQNQPDIHGGTVVLLNQHLHVPIARAAFCSGVAPIQVSWVATSVHTDGQHGLPRAVATAHKQNTGVQGYVVSFCGNQTTMAVFRDLWFSDLVAIASATCTSEYSSGCNVCVCVCGGGGRHKRQCQSVRPSIHLPKTE